jgi:hypothetical protein
VNRRPTINRGVHKMKQLKIIFLIMLMALIFVLGWFDPVSTVGRFILPDGCRKYCREKMPCEPGRDKTVHLTDGFHGRLISAVIPSEERD